MSKSTMKSSGAPVQVGATVPTRSFVSSVWWKVATHVLFGTRMSPYAAGENTLAKDVLGALDGGMLCLADFGYQMWRHALATNAQLLWAAQEECDSGL